MAKPTEKITCRVPETTRLPLGLSTRWQAPSQLRLNSCISATPRDTSQWPLSTLTMRPEWQVTPPLLRK